ncbi:GNAT family N-acetyltransferase [Corallincola platygyrae]|uniref:GNAT family N-acetyltransferase n=1 Tax=Corallincola platygyrae TaxID=1193278 RepID=A0ABW4XNP8_9GAMM
MSLVITQASAEALESYLTPLSELLLDGVKSGASIGFVEPLSSDDAKQFWQASVFPAVGCGERILWLAEYEQRLIGTVQLEVSMMPNQAHRCEVAKLMVHSGFRRHGVGKKLMRELMAKATKLQKQLITLDTRTGDASQALYASLGFQVAGEIPGFALDPDCKKLSGTTYMYLPLE